jgi:hypothetical protein
MYPYPYEIGDILRSIQKAVRCNTDSGGEGGYAWGAKQDLYKIKWAAEEALKQCNIFEEEDQWLKEQEKKKIVKILSNDIQ